MYNDMTADVSSTAQLADNLLFVLTTDNQI